MALIESEADAIAWAHQMAKTPTTGDHEVTDPHPYCLGDDPCCCVQLIAAEQTARADERERAAGRVQALIDDGPHYEACPHWEVAFDDMLEMVRVGIACECALIGDTYRDALAAIREAE